jgi:hypothetical protein
MGLAVLRAEYRFRREAGFRPTIWRRFSHCAGGQPGDRFSSESDTQAEL